MTTILKTVPLTAALCLAAQTLFAADGVLIVQKTTSGGNTQTNQIQIEKTRMRMEGSGSNGAKQVFVFDGNAQVMRIIDDEKKTYSEMTKADADRLGAQVSDAMAQVQEQLKNLPPEQRAQVEAMMRGRANATAAIVKTEYRKNGTDRVGRWTCDKYDGYRDNQKVSEMCTVDPSALGLTAADFEVTKQLAAFFQKLMPQNADQMFKIGTPTEQGFSGVPVRSTSTFLSRQTVTEMSEVTRQNFPDAIFAVPAGYRKDAGPLGGRGR